MKRGLVVLLILGGAWAGLVSAPAAHADPIDGYPQCAVDKWGFLGLTQKRLICDDPRQADGSWSRERAIVIPGYHVNPGSDCSYSSYSSHCSFHDAYDVATKTLEDTTYIVTDDNVPAGEPGHLPG